MVNKVANRVRITKIHPKCDAGKCESFVVVIRDVDGVAKKGLVYGLAAIFQQDEMQLMDMECVKFAGAVFDDPVLDGSLLHNNVGNARFWIELHGGLAIDREVKLGCAVGIVGLKKLFRKVKPARACRSDASQPR